MDKVTDTGGFDGHGPPRAECSDAYWLAEQFIGLSVHSRDITVVIGLPAEKVRAVLERAGRSNPLGPPFKIERWLERASSMRRMQAAIFLDAVQRMGVAGQSPGRTVLEAFRRYRELTPVPEQLAFPVALALVRCCFGWWGQETMCRLERCGRCGVSYLRQTTDIRNDALLCTYCGYQARHRRAPRMRRPRRIRLVRLPEAVVTWVQRAFVEPRAETPP
ncbi:FlhC family transcriptional regulator [Rugamonas aquatica]|uniref:Flagellar transcriptional regulator FlhC n=1 Tax=Rugamonas aquatica TaxID=2743357 RepID=A0A6A7N750_9BURK|nr:FlhC family transcriptional regulator [Rugamonas aquatica]MQA40627.1 hypothetical protein [Rugamonas aquatica]